MENIKQELNGNILTLTIDISKRIGASKSGKSEKVATTGGNVKLDGTGLMMGVNVFEPVAKELK